jgi:hypothetical protein
VTTSDPSTEKIVVGSTELFRVTQLTAQRGPIVTAFDGSAWWVYAPTVTGPQLVRYSLARDRVLVRVPAPAFTRVDLVATGAGAWLVNVNATGPRGYHVSPGGRRVALDGPSGRASWAVAHGSTVWVGTAAPAAVWRIDGTRVRRLRTWRGAAPITAAYGSGAIWAIDRRVQTSTRVLRIDPKTGADRVAGVLRGAHLGFVFGNWFAGAFWFVNDQRLYRFRPSR